MGERCKSMATAAISVIGAVTHLGDLRRFGDGLWLGVGTGGWCICTLDRLGRLSSCEEICVK